VYGGLAEPERTDLLERSTAPSPSPLSSGPDGAIRVPLGPADIATVAAVPLHRPELRHPEREQRLPAHEPAQPLFTRYWLHNTGPAPIGGLPTNISLTRLPTQDMFRVTVSASARPARGTVELDVPTGLHALPLGPLDYDLRPGDHAEFEIRVRPDEDTPPGTYFLAARIRDDEERLLEDALPVAHPGTGAPHELSARLTRTAPGRLTLHLTNPARSEARGEARLISPYGTWGAPGDAIAVIPRLHGFTVAPGATAALTYTVSTAPDAAPAGEWWALAKVTSFGHVSYTDTVRLTTDGRGRLTTEGRGRLD
jgi:hypothetical protein